MYVMKPFYGSDITKHLVIFVYRGPQYGAKIRKFDCFLKRGEALQNIIDQLHFHLGWKISRWCLSVSQLA